jgi:CDP-diglyceride synthetase
MEKGLKLRLISSLIMAPIAIGLIVMLPTPYFALVLGAFFVAGAWEWAALVSVPKLGALYVYRFGGRINDRGLVFVNCNSCVYYHSHFSRCWLVDINFVVGVDLSPVVPDVE